MTVEPHYPTKKCKLALVIGIPSDDDDRKGSIFSGGDGYILDVALRQANIDRDECLLLPIFDNRSEALEKIGDKEYQEVAFSRTSAIIAAYGPPVVVPLGDTACWGFTGDKRIAAYRGAVTKATRISPLHKLVPSYDPSSVRKDYRLLTLLVFDLMKAAAEAAKGPLITYSEKQIYIEPEPWDLPKWEDACAAADTLSIDIETGWGQITCIGFAPSATTAYVVPFVDMRQNDKSYWPSVETEVMAWETVRRICANSVPKLGQNFSYDFFWLWDRYGIKVNNYRYDTRLQHKSLYPELQADLASMAATYSSVGAYKTWGGKYQNAEKRDG